MDFKNEEARLLFLKYASPCAETLVKRGTVTKKQMNDMLVDVSYRRESSKDAAKKFKTAIFICKKIAKKLNKKIIDVEVIRRYFLLEHDKIVDGRYKMFKDFDPQKCRTYSGKIISTKNGFAIVNTIIGNKKYRTDFVPQLKVGNYVIVHRNFIIERINKNLAEKLWRLKDDYFKSKKVL
jgi:hydrogenase maturation factor